MVYRNPDRREGQSQKGTDYADEVTKFMKALGFVLESRAEDSGEHEDLVFEPIIGGMRPVVCEAKARDEDSPGFSPNDYKKGFAERFRAWESGAYERYRFYLFFEVESNQSYWKDLFDRVKIEEIETFYQKIASDESVSGDLADFIHKHDHTTFAKFAEDSVVWSGYDKGDLSRIRERTQETGEYVANPYLESYEAYPESASLSSNFVRIEKLPEKLYRFPTVKKADAKSFWRYQDNRKNPVYFHSGYVYSFQPPENTPQSALNFCSSTNADQLDFSNWASSDPSEAEEDISKALLRDLMVLYVTEYKEKTFHMTRERNDTRLYAGDDDHFEVSNRSLIFELDKYTGFRHRAVVLRVEYLSGNYYYSLVPKMEFTFDGEEPVPGDLKSKRSADFNPGKVPEQNSRKAKQVEDWVEVLTPSESLDTLTAPEPIQQMNLVWLADLKLGGIRPPRDSDEQRALIESGVSALRDNIEFPDVPTDKSQSQLGSKRWSK
jgi:hypothetical protein